MFVILPLLWRSFRIRKRFYFRTIFELVWPTIMALILIKLGSSIDPGGSSVHLNSTDPPKFPKEALFNTFDVAYIFYAPEDNVTTSIMKSAVSMLNVNTTQKSVHLESCASFQEMEKKLFSIFGNDTSNSAGGYGVEFRQLPKGQSNDFVYAIRGAKGDIWQTDKKFPNIQTPGPGLNNDQYVYSGFLIIQASINDAILEFKKIEFPTNFTMQEFPYPAYDSASRFEKLFSSFIPSFTVNGFIVLILVVNLVIEEKNSGCREWVKMTGVSSLNLWFSWLLHCMILYTINVTILTILYSISLDGTRLLSSPGFFLWILLFLFCTNTVLSMLCVSSLFNSTTVASVACFIFYFLPAFIVEQLYEKYTFNVALKVITCFFPTVTLNWAFLTISGFEASRESITFGSLFLTHSGGGNNLPLGAVFLCQIASILIYTLLLLYIDAVFPGKYGRAEPWYFIFQPIVNLIAPSRSSEGKGNPENKSGLYEKIVDRPVGLRFHELKKTFGNFTAVDNLSIDIYKGQITALLGHNGAGKTTLINIITGMYSPTSGSVYQDGSNVFENFSAYQKKIGMCPQHNLLLPYLTVSEHIIFFGMMRGLSQSGATIESRNLLDFFGILDKSNKLTKKLSGGMKRKLCLSISLIGDPKLLILDEPTSGMDPESRRDTWNKLLSLRGNRTVLLTTHFMEEADVLGDMIAIMDHGSLKCYGTPMFLKKNYGLYSSFHF